MEEAYPYIHRDISWLSFNYRVLQEAQDQTNPLLERIKFLAIYSSNLDEYFRVRVAQHRNLLRVGKKTKKQLDFNPKSLIKKINKIVNQQQEEFSDIFTNQIIPELEKNNIYLNVVDDLNAEQREFVESFFQDNLLPFVQPVLLVKNKVRPFLNNASLYMTILLRDKNQSDGEEFSYAIVKVPSDHIERFVKLPSRDGEEHIIMLDDIVRHSANWLFPGYEIVSSHSIKLTRDAELYIDDEFSGDLIEKIKKSLTKRNVGPASRLVYDRDMPQVLLNFLIENFDLESIDLLPEGRYHNNMDFFSFPSFGLNHLKDTPLPPLSYEKLEKSDDIFESIDEEDHLLIYPYHSYHSVIEFFEQAAHDPYVTHIKVVQYRVAQNSRIMNALIEAVKLGKRVSVFIEVKARFDEEANLRWGEILEQAGVNVHYSFPGLKVHSKLALIRKSDDEGVKLYAYLSTGNFHEETAKIYSDLGLFTSDPRISTEVARVFTFLETVKIPANEFEHLLVGQFNLRSRLEELIDQEMKRAKAGEEARITLKLNSVEDKKMIVKLYEASQAGVKIKMIVRGICCLVPGIEGISENIEVVSIVDRYLEHARVYIFHNGGEELIYLSSADFMTRNLSRRIEASFPIYDENIRQTVLNFVDLQMRDNVKARIIDESQKNNYRRNKGDIAIRSQMDIYYYIRRLDELNKAELEEKTG